MVEAVVFRFHRNRTSTIGNMFVHHCLRRAGRRHHRIRHKHEQRTNAGRWVQFRSMPASNVRSISRRDLETGPVLFAYSRCRPVLIALR